MTRQIPADTKARAVEMYASGMGCEHVGKALGVSKDAVLIWVRASGGTVRKVGRPRKARPTPIADKSAPTGRRVRVGMVWKWVAA